MDASPVISVVVSTRNRGEMIKQALESILSVRHRSFELIVVDQSTDSVTEDIVRTIALEDGRLHYVRSRQKGLSRGRNAGVAASRAEIVAFTDDDCVVDDAWLDEIERELSDPGVGGVFGRVLPSEFRGRTGTDLAFKSSTRRVEYSGRCIPWHIGHGANMAFKREALDDATGFDQILGAGGPLPSHEDGDMSYRVLARGWKIVFSPRPLVHHRQWRDWVERKSVERAYGLGAGGQFIKYVRCGDSYGWRLFATWIWQLGVRRVGAGLLKWRSPKVIFLGISQLIYPLVGAWRSLAYEVDRANAIYLSEATPVGDLLGDGLDGGRSDGPSVGTGADLAAKASRVLEQR